MSIIYRPCGMTREYSPYALNIYMWFNLKDGKYYDTTRRTIHLVKMENII